MSLPPADRHRARVARIVLLAVLLPLFLVAGCTAFVISSVTRSLEAQPAIAFTVLDGSCSIDPAEGTALVELTMTTESRIGNTFRLEPLSARDLTLEGIASLPDEDRTRLRELLDEHDDSGRVNADTTAVVLEFDRERDDTESTMSTITLRWAIGDRTAVQDVPLDFVWTSDSCSVDPG